ncbi:unnamed protein product [Enterobius vermicularis]|uniref:NADPH--hemoprotein reductase n=1 Tax=Enterobius vermicularis TaxID=51028 RepID=A0A0N4V371_ENTVE|nr:unnamed protein product [Enterobius vermicularis]
MYPAGTKPSSASELACKRQRGSLVSRVPTIMVCEYLRIKYNFFNINLLQLKYTGYSSPLTFNADSTIPFDQKNPVLGTVLVNRELHTPRSSRSCRHIEIQVDPRLRYEAGDHLGVFPSNDSELVEELGSLLNADMEQAFRLHSSKRHPFPCPCTVRTALTHYVDICAPVKSHVLKAIAEFAQDPDEKERLALLSTADEKGLAEYGQFIQNERRSIVDVLRHFSSCKPPVDYLLELLPRLQARYYSISSSPKYSPTTISITAVITRYRIGNRLIKGLCTNFLLKKKKDDKLPVFVRRSTMRLPHQINSPVIMIGPGTGFAPFRSFLQERKWQKEHEELEAYVKEGVLTELNLAFSRITDKKIYVQHKLWENREKIWKYLGSGAYVYVCGDARNMARDVQNTLLEIYTNVGGNENASKYQEELEKQRRYQADVWS